MNRRHFIALTLGAGGLAALGAKVFPRNLNRAEQKAWAFGSEISLIAYHEDRATAQSAVRAALKAMVEMEEVLSLYRPQSEICRLNRDAVLEQPHQDLLTVLRHALEWSRLTDGAFDPTVQPLWTLHASGRTPTLSELEEARRLVDFRKVHIRGNCIRLAPGQAITLNGIAQGFAADRVREVLCAHGIRHALANTGEFCALGGKPEGEAWRIGIQHPRVRDAYVALAALSDRFLSTSGDYQTKFSHDFSSHHVFDPVTGRSPAALSSVTVVAPSGLEADALSTAIFVLGPSRGLELAASRPNVDALLVLKNGYVLSTANFPKLV